MKPMGVEDTEKLRMKFHYPQNLDERQRRIVDECVHYLTNPCGLPGHTLMLVIGAYASAYNQQIQQMIDRLQTVSADSEKTL